MKQVQQIGQRDGVPPTKGKPVQSAPVPPFSLQKTEREKVKPAAGPGSWRDEGMNDAAAPVAYAGQPLKAPDDGTMAPVSDRSSTGNRDARTATTEPALEPVELAGQSMLMDDLAQLGANPGVFEVMLPNGDTLGVSVDHRQQSVMFLLSASSETLTRKLKRQSVELQSQLAQRMKTEVGLAVL
ncbi:MAG TPA: hypothetical protein VIF60_01790 [Burkholderiaceae bacterium]|jgi:hypothetical protein